MSTRNKTTRNKPCEIHRWGVSYAGITTTFAKRSAAERFIRDLHKYASESRGNTVKAVAIRIPEKKEAVN